MGFERLCMAIQKKRSNYDTDVFMPMIDFISKACGIKYGTAETTDIAMRVMADHIRAISFVIADGQLPSNNKAGYVIRRILRRAVRYAYTFLNLKDPFLYKLVPVLGNQLAHVFPELKQQEDFVSKVIQEEEISFLRTLDIGLGKMEEIREELKGKSTTIDGKRTFELYDTFGFPLDLIQLIARENGLTVDEAGFDVEMAAQKQRSKKAASVETGDWTIVTEDDEVEFVGYDHLIATSRIIKYRQVKTKGKDQYQIVLDTTPFYAESGGQAGDTGYLVQGTQKINVLQTQKENNLIIHITEQLPSDLKATVECKVNVLQRSLTENNHSATHLLHAALKRVLGEHVNQKGSLVNEQVLRFDFSHFSKVTDEELKKVELIVNEKIRENIALNERRNVPIAEAKKLGAMALFGEKYGEYVRMITFDETFSRELCGGTHVPSTGKIGFFKIVSESSVAAGVRRIEALTATAAETFVDEQQRTITKLQDLLKNPKDLVKAIEDLVEEKAVLQHQLNELQAEKSHAIALSLKEKKIEKVGDINLIRVKVELPSTEAMRQVAYELKQTVPNLLLVLAADVQGKPNIAVMISDNLVAEKGLNASQIIRELSKEIQGGGGGQPFYATAGGKELAGLDKVVAKAIDIIQVKA